MSSGDDRHLTAPDGTELRYHVRGPAHGPGPVFLFIHGLGSNWTRWKRLAEDPFFQSYRMIIPDLRGHGGSITRRGIHANGFAADLEVILKQEGVSRPLMVGHCLGANVGVRVWERDPGNVLALVLIEPFMTEDLQRTWKILHAILQPVVGGIGALARMLNRLGLQRRRFRKIDYSVYDDWVRPRLTSLFNVIRYMGPWFDFQCMPIASYLASYQVLFDYRPPWRKIDVPVLALIARQGGVLSHESGEHPLDRPGVQRVVIESSHFVLTDNRNEVVRRIKTFVEGLKRDGRWND